MTGSNLCRYCGRTTQPNLTITLNAQTLCSLACHAEAVKIIERAKVLALKDKHRQSTVSPSEQRRINQVQKILRWFDEPTPTSQQDLRTPLVHPTGKEYERAKWRGYALPPYWG